MTRLVRLRALGPWHLGARGVGMEETGTSVGADTLFSGLCHARLHLRGDVEGFLKPFLEGRPPFRVSSAFPFGPEGWYPVRPQGTRVEWGDAKTLKKVRYVHERAWLAWQARAEPQEAEWEVSGEFLCPKGARSPIRAEPMPHVTLDRTTSASNLYFTGELFFREGCGMAFLLDAADAAQVDEVLSLVGWLGDAGIGGERSTGRGQFAVSDADAPIGYGTGARVALLSPYAPRDAAEIAGWDLGRSAYYLQVRRGYMDAPGAGGLRRKSVRVLAEGSVLTRGNGGVEAAGMLADVTPSVHSGHRVYRYGLPFTAVWNA